MKNKKGFTLIELLAVIAILGIVITITGISVSGVLKSSKKDVNNIQNDEIEKAARYYVTKNMSLCKENGCTIDVQTLISEGYLDNSNNIPEGNIKVVKEGDKFKYYTNLTYNGNVVGDIIDFTYTGSVQTYTIPNTGKYKLEVWGAQGGSYNETYYGGKGGYSKGIISLSKGTKLYIYVGGKGTSPGTLTSGVVEGGFNGGGKGSFASTTYLSGGGGGASDIRIEEDSLYSRVIVAGGGGSFGSYSSSATAKRSGGAGGGTSGLNGNQYTSSYKPGAGGNQTTPGVSYYGTTENSTYGTLASFGVGGGGISTSYSIVGGGGGWYGGGYGRKSSGGGGSGYVYTSETASNYPSGCLLNSSYYLTNAETIAGDQNFLSPDWETETGHSGNGHVRITKE